MDGKMTLDLVLLRCLPMQHLTTTCHVKLAGCWFGSKVPTQQYSSLKFIADANKLVAVLAIFSSGTI
ncbi:hypothetical protein OPV22_027758 [Ensete ventricosum]|uniref:Uncharacterized protein n=1 Tax=Ensete ventricosum TaxID=4639 RepID=A0AAV8PYG6_ENSVE|nr:hypothetical protein OPV22_027758 [Ensete ventricosum]